MGKKPKQVFAVRVSDLARQLVEHECKETGESEGEVVERCILAQINSPAAQRLIVQAIKQNPSLKPIIDAFLAQIKHNKNGDDGSV